MRGFSNWLTDGVGCLTQESPNEKDFVAFTLPFGRLPDRIIKGPPIKWKDMFPQGPPLTSREWLFKYGTVNIKTLRLLWRV